MPQRSLKQLTTWYRAQQPLLRWLLGGCALLIAILAGGTITAYGGLALVVLLWALCMGALALLLKTAWELSFPGERLRGDRAFCRAFAVGAALGVLVIAALVLYRRTVYAEDGINYYAKQELLLGSFAINGFYGVRELVDNLLRADYKMFVSLFISVPYLLTGRTIQSFMICYALTCFVPVWFAGLMAAKKLKQAFGGGHGGLYYAVCMLAMVLWPLFLWPATHGMPDAFGLVFVAVILLLSAGTRFETPEPRRLLALFFATFALVLTRRWYMYWIVAYYAVYALALLAGAARRRCFGRTLANLLKFGIPSVLGIVLPLFLTFRTILSTDYTDLYGSYYGGGFLANCAAQVGKQGWGMLALVLLGLLAALANKKLAAPALVVLGSGVGAMALFTHTQSLGDHQSLILAPVYLGFVFCAAAWAAARPRGAAARFGLCAAAVFFALNFGNALRLPGWNSATAFFSNESLDLTRRTDLAQMRAVTDFVLENCAEGDTVYININSGGYSGSTFAFSDAAHPELQSRILWENSVPSTHGFPTGIWSSRYVMVTDQLDAGGLIGGVNTALRTDTPAAAHYRYVTEFPLAGGVVLYCYERISPPDAAEAEYFKQLFAEYDARWPAIYSERIDAYLAQG